MINLTLINQLPPTMSKSPFCVALTLATVTVCIPCEGLANESTELEAIVIEGKRQPRSDAQHMSEQDIKRQPTRNGNIVDLLHNNMAVQFSNTANASMQGGEISSDTVSFHGEPYYNNAFVIDGFSNNDTMNPGSSNSGYNSAEDFESPTAMYLAPGSPEAFQVDSSLVAQLNVYDSNVPAKYNRFTGGVVDAELKNPDSKQASGSIGFRTTRNSWTRMHIPEDLQEDFNEDADNNVQPKFVKQIYNLTVNQPLNDQAALLFSYNRTQSHIPEEHTVLGQRVDEKRLAQTLMLKGLYQANDNNRLTATMVYSPHENTYYANNVKDGRYTSSGGGWRANVNWQHDFAHGNVETTVAHTQNRNRIAYDAGYDYYAWLGNVSNSSLDWCSVQTSSGCRYAIEGGLGTLESTTNTWTFKQDWNWDPITLGDNHVHKLDFGWSMDIARAHSQRPEDVRYMYMYNNSSNGYPNNVTNVSPDCRDCIAGEQYQTRMLSYKAYDATARVNNHSAYLQDTVALGRVTLIPGINFNYDDFLGNLNTSPRFAFNVDVFNDKRLHVFGGLNRYYAGNMLAYALRSKIPYNEVYLRANDPQHGESDWAFSEYANNSVAWDTADLKTPYSNEANIGFDYTWGNHIVSSKFVRRDSHDQFKPSRRDDGVKTMTNEGSTSANSYVLGLRSKAPYQYGPMVLGYELGARYQTTKTNNHGNYDDSLVADVTSERIPYYLFEGKRYESAEDLPPFNYNKPWEAFLALQTDFPKWHLSWTHRLNYRDGYSHYNRNSVTVCSESSQAQACGDWNGRVYDYQKRTFKDAFTLDWRFLVDIPVRGKQKFELSLDVLNVFDNKVASSNSQSTYLGGTDSQTTASYELGRQFWLGAAYRW